MATRKETHLRRQAIHDELRAACHNGALPMGEPLPPVRELAGRYRVSHRLVSEALGLLMAEGLLYSVPRVGTFVGRAPATTLEPYLLVSRQARTAHTFLDGVQTGFEDRIAQQGGASDALTIQEAIAHGKRNELPALSGVFFYDFLLPLQTELPQLADIPKVAFGALAAQEPTLDSVDFDDEDGGAQAARHLLQMGHRNIAFLGLHHTISNESPFPWSIKREAGWIRQMESAGQATENLTFRPTTTVPNATQNQTMLARAAAAPLAENAQISAVIAVNSLAAQGLFEALDAAGVPTEQWPAIVCFDETPRSRASGVSYLRLPWEKIGAEAAQLLWERQTGRLTGPSQHRLVKMHLIPRLTSRPDWARSSSLAQQRVAGVGKARPSSDK